MKERIYTVSALIREVNSFLKEGFRKIEVEGEVTNLSQSGRGHLYFSLKDEGAQMDCVMWASTAGRLRFELEDGLAVRVRGELTIYPGRGRFQMVVSAVEPQGTGALQLAFEQLKKRLETEGLFDAERKQELPALPLRVGIVTSAGAAALRDMLKILRRSHPLDILLSPASVQGEGAGREIAVAIRALVARGDRDMIIVGRGGGSLEDLWAFNTEEVARAIADCPLPLISGVGHETDFSISDFCADIRAATPTHAAELIVSAVDESYRRFDEGELRLRRAMVQEVERSRHTIRSLLSSAGLARLPERLRRFRLRLEAVRRLPGLLQRLSRRSRERMEAAEKQIQLFPGRILSKTDLRLVDNLIDQLVSRFRSRLLHSTSIVAAQERALSHLSPQKVLGRGYSITTLEGRKTPLRSAAGLRRGAVLRTTLAEGSIRSLVAAGPKPQVKVETLNPEQANLFDEGGHGESETQE